MTKSTTGKALLSTDPLAETIIRGRSVADWSSVIDEILQEAEDTQRQPDRIPVVDLTEKIPPDITHAVDVWHLAGCPSRQDEIDRNIADLQRKSKAQCALAAMESKKARALMALGHIESAQRHSKYSINHQTKAYSLAKQIQEIESLGTVL